MIGVGSGGRALGVWPCVETPSRATRHHICEQMSRYDAGKYFLPRGVFGPTFVDRSKRRGLLSGVRQHGLFAEPLVHRDGYHS